MNSYYSIELTTSEGVWHDYILAEESMKYNAYWADPMHYAFIPFVKSTLYEGWEPVRLKTEKEAKQLWNDVKEQYSDKTIDISNYQIVFREYK